MQSTYTYYALKSTLPLCRSFTIQHLTKQLFINYQKQTTEKQSKLDTNKATFINSSTLHTHPTFDFHIRSS